MQTSLALRVTEMEESQTLKMAAKGRELKAAGHDVIAMNLGEPDFQTPQHIKDAAKKALDEGHTFYTPVSGIAPLRQAIADKLKRENNIPATPEQIVVSTGAKQSIANVMLSLLNPGDEIIILSPYWVSYVGIAQLAEGKPVFVQGKAENDFKATAAEIEAAITPRTKALIFSTPCNPTGAVFSEEELTVMADMLQKYPEVTVIADEIYELINYTEKHFSIGSLPNMQNRTVTVNGFSKGFAMTGWRVGYICAPVELAKACNKIQGQVTSGTNSIAQHAAAHALNSDLAPSLKMTEAYAKRRELIKDLLDEIPGVKTNTPQGAFYIFPDISTFFGKQTPEGEAINSADDLAMYLLNSAHVSVVMGEAFGEPNCIRISYAASEEHIREGVRRIREALEGLK